MGLTTTSLRRSSFRLLSPLLIGALFILGSPHAWAMAVIGNEQEMETPPQDDIDVLYQDLKRDFEANPIFKNENINMYRDGVLSPWNDLSRGGNKFQATPLTQSQIKDLKPYQMLSPKVFRLAMKGMNRIIDKNGPHSIRNDVLTVIDFSLHISYRRLFVFDLKNRKVLFNTWTSHGFGSDPSYSGYATKFSNDGGTKQSSVGFYRTTDQKCFDGKYIYSIRVEGIDGNLNSAAYGRGILFHNGTAFTPDMVRYYLSGNQKTIFPYFYSDGCFMISLFESGRFYGLEDKPLVELIEDTINFGSLVYVHTDEIDMETRSRWLRPGDST